MAKRKSAPSEDEAPQSYTVLARRYRPQQFAEIIGQEAVARALVNALQSNRVAHAYLFTGARGVGKTSTARILAKALNCEKGPTATPCGVCDTCRSIATGEDVDVLEIDAASNRGIDEVRAVRNNVQYRPQRGRFKIYIIDEVHMLTREAFNALLKTLEEPPPHVKFIFATTEVQKIPVTILSRCQRFDFVGIGSGRIVAHLREIVKSEGLEADDEALELIARRAGGSMRDAQSLLDQLLAFGGERLTTDQVHQLLGTAHDDRVAALAAAVLEKQPTKALDLLAESANEGLQLGELVDQLIEYWRDLMVVQCAGAEARDLSVPNRHRETLTRQAKALSLDTILAGLDVLSSTKGRLRGSNHGRVLIEMALVRLGRLDDLASLTQLAEMLAGGGSPKGMKPPTAPPRLAAPPEAGRTGNPLQSGSSNPQSAIRNPQSADAPRAPVVTPLTADSLAAIWADALGQIGPMMRSQWEKGGIPAIFGPNTLAMRFPAEYNHQREHCQQPDQVKKMEVVLRTLTGQAWTVRIDSEAVAGPAKAPTGTEEPDGSPPRARRQRDEALKEPLIKRAVDVLEAQVVRVDDGFGAAPAPLGERSEDTNSEEA